jgi:hypothetical protein
MMDLSIALFLLVLINILIYIARGQSRAWLRVLLMSVSFLLLIVAFLFGIRAIR